MNNGNGSGLEQVAPLSADSVAHEARGTATEAMGAVRSLERLTDLQFKVMEAKQEEIIKLIKEACTKIDDLDKKYDTKFWSLAYALIMVLLGMVGFLIIYTLFPGHS